MTSLNVAVVSRDPTVRLAAARAFDQAPSSWNVHLHEATPQDADVLVFGADLRDQAQGEILFDPADGADVIEEVRRSIASVRSKVFVVTGAGRGVGVTSLALHLAAGAARERSTCFLDLDLAWGAADRLGIHADHRSWSDVSDGEDDFRMAALPVAGGFRALLAPAGGPSATGAPDDVDGPARGETVDVAGRRPLRVTRPPGVAGRETGPGPRQAAHAALPPRAGFNDDFVQGMLRRAGDLFERVVIDCPGRGLLDDVLGIADAAVLVVPPTMPGARRAATLLEGHPTGRWAVVLNRIGPGGETPRAELHRLLGRRAAIELPCSPPLRDAEDDGRLLSSSWTRYARRVDRLLRALESAS